MYRIRATPTVASQLARQPGLREHVEETLTGILETAMELRASHDMRLDGDDRFMRIRVRDYMISYTLDVESGTATIVFAEKLPAGGKGRAA
jgi:mRNA-degrading endonuclease RelE of RelBE toxin-antitoxin system